MARKRIHRCRSWFTPVVVSIAITGALGMAPVAAAATSEGAGPGPRDAPAARTSTPDRQTARSSATKASGASHTIRLKSRRFAPDVTTSTWIDELQQLRRIDRERIHLLVQLETIPDSAERGNLEALGLSLLAYVPEQTWIASFPADDPARIATLPGVVWAGELTVDDKLDPAIKNGLWGSWNLAPDGTAAVFIAMHKDETLDAGRNLVTASAGRVVGVVTGINLVVAEMPLDTVHALAGDDAVQWIEPAAMPLEPVNDGSRAFINVDALQGAPYNLDGTPIDVLVYDSGQAGDHLDFGTRLTHGDADTVSEHSTHVAGIVGGDGSASAAHGGSALQWRGMAPNVDLISYGTEGYSGTGVIFYQDVPDIENDWAAAQNLYGADLANASLGSNIYNNYYPTGCNVMGLYGAASVLIDQLVRGGNPVAGIGDRYIAAWAAGNETGWATSCGTYGTTAPPASAKNPIHVGGANTDNGGLYSHSSWGPTADGRLKPTITAGACQVSGDFGVTSTDNNPVDDYTVKCGTSMATPAVAGGIALMLEHYRSEYSTSGNFWPSTAKAILIQTAVDSGTAGPDYQRGYGNVDIQAAVDLITRHAFRQETSAAGEVDEFSFDVAGTTDDVMVSLAWDDFEATLNANPTLINDLDLVLIAPDGSTWRPWILDPANPANPATRGLNTVDNQEQVLVPAANVTTGRWLARVAGTTVPQSPQSYSLACEGCAVGQHANLTVSVSPSGSGTVTGSGIACEGDCWEVYALNATVVLTAAAAPGFGFDSWNGCDSPSGATCTMTMDSNATVTANFQPISILDVVIAPAGGGAVTGSGINCPGDCTEPYPVNTVVVLDAAAAPGHVFSAWTGCDSPAGATCTMTMNVSKTVTANFQAVAVLDVAIDPVGGGSVTGNGINCPGDCTETYPLNTVVVLDAAANAGYAFDSWTGCDSPAGASCTMTMDADKTATANFRAVATLYVEISPSEGGSVTGDGIDCPTDCSEVFDLGTTVELTAVAGSTYHFIQWIGCDSANGALCTVTMDIDTTVTAQFAVNVPTASPVGLAILTALIALSAFVLLRRIS